MTPLLLAALPEVVKLLGPLLTKAAQHGGGQPSEPEALPASTLDPAVLAALVAAAQKPAEPPPEIKLPTAAAAVATIIVIGFFALLAAITALLLFGDIERFSAALAVLCVGFGVLSSKFGTVVDFLFGSSWGSRQKDARPPVEPAGSPIFLPPVVTPSPPVVEPGTPVEPPVSSEGIGRSTAPETGTNLLSLPPDGRPASIRACNPGATYPAKAAAKFGQLGYAVIGGGHKIAVFPHPVNGAAWCFDLLYRNYTGMTIGAAGDKWTGGTEFSIPGYDPNAILAKESLDKPAVAIALMKAVARREAGKESPLTDEQWAQAYAMFKAGSADAWLTGGNSLARPPSRAKAADLAEAIVTAMRRKNYALDAKPGEVNVVYIEGLNEDGTINDDAPDGWNDLRVVVGFDSATPVVLGKWQATTEPGRFYTDQSVNSAGAARIEFGQYTAWRVGMHRGHHEALVQRAPITVARDANRDMLRTSDARDTGEFGINQHGGYDQSEASVGKASAGCLVGRTMAGHRAFMAIVKGDPRYVEDPEYMFRTAILAEKDVVG